MFCAVAFGFLAVLLPPDAVFFFAQLERASFRASFFAAFRSFRPCFMLLIASRFPESFDLAGVVEAAFFMGEGASDVVPERLPEEEDFLLEVPER